MTPANTEDDLVWAGFPKLKAQFEKRIKRSIRIPNSSLVLNWGEYGSGKTHAARFFSKKSVLEKIAGDGSIPYSMVLPLPKGKEPVIAIFTAVIDKLQFKLIREQFDKSDIDIAQVVEAITENTLIQSVLKAIFNSDDNDLDLLRKYLYGNVTKSELSGLNKYGILRQLSSDTDYTKLLAGLFTCLTYKKQVYSSIIIWLDEFEDLAILSSSNIDKTNNFLREVIDNTPDNLLIFLNLTQSSLFGVEDLGQYVYESVRSRIKERISFDLPSNDEFKEYIKSLLAYFRIEGEHQGFFPFEEETIDEVLRVQTNASLRKVNEDLSLLLELAEMEDECPITKSFYEDNKGDIIGWKE